MSNKPRALACNDPEVFPFNHSLRIPPLLDPLPLLPSRRPSPLEPNARINEGSHNATARLSSRSKALAEAKSIGDDDVAPEYSLRPRATGNGHISAKSLVTAENSRKRQKTDYFRLPNPTAKARANKPPPFKPVPVLNELHEPPPSAALFPPITPNARHETAHTAGLESNLLLSHDQGRRRGQSRKVSPVQEPRVSSAKVTKGRAKRICLRGRLKWTESETEDLMKGVGIFGVGKWKKILNHPDLKFHPDRTMVDLKDRYRTCRMNEEKAIERQAADENVQSSSLEQNRERQNKSKLTPMHTGTLSGDGTEAVTHNSPPLSTKGPRSTCSTPSSDLSQSTSAFNVFTPKNFSAQAMSKGKKPHASQPWTAEEDADLSKGYQKYGFQWTAIAKDKALCLSHRTGAQVRDRFRMKYPIVYQSSIPLPLPDVTKRPPRSRSERKPPSNVSSSAKLVPRNSSSQLKFIINDAVSAPIRNSSKTSVSISSKNPGRSRPVNLSNRMPDTLNMVDRFSGLDVQPLPDPEPEEDEQSGSETSDEPSTAERSRQSTAEAEEARHLSILGLLNEDSEQNSRLPPFKYPFDDEWASGSVTLPPLQWEEMASRPIFELE